MMSPRMLIYRLGFYLEPRETTVIFQADLPTQYQDPRVGRALGKTLGKATSRRITGYQSKYRSGVLQMRGAGGAAAWVAKRRSPSGL